MTLRFTCPGCNRVFSKTNTLGGKRAVCRGCAGEFAIPEPSNVAIGSNLNFTCPMCEHVYRKPNRLIGQRTRCRACDTVFVVPESSLAAAPASVPKPVPRPVAAARPMPAMSTSTSMSPPPRPTAPRPALAAVAPSSPPAPAAPSRPAPARPAVPADEEPLMLEILDDEPADPYAIQVSAADQPTMLADRPSRPSAGAGSNPAEKRKKRAADRPSFFGGILGVLNGFLELPAIARRAIILAIVLACAAITQLPLPSFQNPISGSFGSAVSSGLDADDSPDTQLDDNPPTVVRPGVLAAHRKALTDLTRGIDRLNSVLKPLDSQARFAAAAARVEEAGTMIEKAANSGQKLEKVNRAESMRLRVDALPALTRALDALTRTLSNGTKNPELRAAYGPMRQAFEPVLSEMLKDYPEAPNSVVEIKVPGVTSPLLSEYVRQRLDIEIPPAYRSRVEIRTDGNTGVQRIRLGGVEEPEEIARRIRFAKVVRTYKRRIYLAVPTPTRDQLADVSASMREQPKVPGRRADRAEAGEPAASPGSWFVVFQGRDPSRWNTNTPTGPTTAVALARVPPNIAYLRLTRLDTNATLIVPVTAAALGADPAIAPDATAPPRWSGTNRDAWGAHHLGIVEGPLIRGGDAAMRGALVVQVVGTDGYTGSGFAHQGFGEERQYHAWRGQEIPPTDFEVAVGPGPLTPDEQTQLLGSAP